MIIEYNGFQIKPHKELPMSYIVVTSGQGGKIPDILTSHYTTPAYAKAEIDKYLTTKEVKGVKAASKEPRQKEESNAEAGNTGRA